MLLVLFVALASAGLVADMVSMPFRVAKTGMQVGAAMAMAPVAMGVGVGVGSMAVGAAVAKKGFDVAREGAQFAREFNEVPEEQTWSTYGTVSSRVVKSSNGGGAFGNEPVIENEIRFRGTTRDGRPLTAADFLDAEMSGQFSGKGQVMEAATGQREVLSPDRSRRDITGVKIEGIGPAVMNVHQRVVAKTPDYARVEFSMDGEVGGGNVFL